MRQREGDETRSLRTDTTISSKYEQSNIQFQEQELWLALLRLDLNLAGQFWWLLF